MGGKEGKRVFGWLDLDQILGVVMGFLFASFIRAGAMLLLPFDSLLEGGGR
jgi:hypothetical protein